MLLQSSVGFVSSDCFAAIHGGLVPDCQSLSVRRPSITQMQHRMPVARASAQAVGFTCRNCNNIFNSRRSMECHRRHVTSQGTPCADPSSGYKSLSFTGRADTSTRILREHPGTLGAFSNCCPRCVLRGSARSLTTIFGVLLVR